MLLPMTRNEPTEDLQARIQKKLHALAQDTTPLSPPPPPAHRTKITTTFWGNAWAKHIATLSPYLALFPRGRKLYRSGAIHHLAISPPHIHALTSSDDLYEQTLTIHPLPQQAWNHFLQLCQGQVTSVLDLLNGTIPPSILTLLTDPENGLFPQPHEIIPCCNCPEYADICEHSAAILYALAPMFDQDPALFFALRQVHPEELITASATADPNQPASPHQLNLPTDSLNSLFQIELEEPDEF